MIKIDNLAIVALFVVSILISGIQDASASSNQTQNYSKYLETNKLIGTMPVIADKVESSTGTRRKSHVLESFGG